MAEPTWRQRWHWLFFPLSVLALLWAAYLLSDAVPLLIDSLSRLNARWLLFTLLGCCLSAYLGFEGFRALFNRFRPGLYRRLPLAHLYFTGQLMKHLPGRVWSVAYQSAAGHRASIAEWVGVNIAHMALITGFALWISATALSWTHGWIPGLAVFASGAGLYAALWNKHLLLPLLERVQRIPIRVISSLCSAMYPVADVNSRFKANVFFWFSISWIVYFIAWAGFGMAWPGLDASDGIWLCALYTAAWLAGYLSLISPSGLGVRELVFVGLTHGFPADAIAGMAIFGRVILLLVDIILGLLFLPGRDLKHD